MSDTFEIMEECTDAGRKQLPYVTGASGIAVALGKRVVAVELFDKPSTCRKVWQRVLSGFILDALTHDTDRESADRADVEQVLSVAETVVWKEYSAVGDGSEYRAEIGDDLASALCLNDTLVHGSVIAQ